MKLTIKHVTSLALAVNELVLNALKHGREQVNVCFRNEGRLARLVVEDDGPGLPEAFDPRTAANIGLSLVTTLTEKDLGGHLTFENRAEGGARICLTVPLESRQQNKSSAPDDLRLVTDDDCEGEQ